ncbi:hypothetical protein PCANC_07372 [Puccinia coronata f. sp. avenae]|uniref:Uncharacterized protein n=1 Tax=Puccinia coronata f. sp. avenae TaxID=200324 RepID=A0A2N5T5E1_9BASI|nr:hypothetical protein PCANC_07372 [Puccinia coronata f. sp. avenae]
MSTHPSSPIASSSRLLEATRPAFDRIRSSYVDRRPAASLDSISVDDNSTSSLSSVDREWQENIRQLHLLIDEYSNGLQLENDEKHNQHTKFLSSTLSYTYTFHHS